jgi:polysaccharide export outer membrane protein
VSRNFYNSGKGDVSMKRTLLQLLLIACILNIFSLTPAAAKPYTIGPGDVLEISVWRDENLSRQLIVPPDGVISFPLINDIEVNNLTVPALRQEISRRLNDFIPDATVTVMLIQINSLQGYVIGKVNRPGQFPISQETTVMQILSMAGGLNPFAAAGKIFIIRRQNGKSIKIPFDYTAVEKGKNLEQNITLKRGDVVVVP